MVAAIWSRFAVLAGPAIATPSGHRAGGQWAELLLEYRGGHRASDGDCTHPSPCPLPQGEGGESLGHRCCG